MKTFILILLISSFAQADYNHADCTKFADIRDPNASRLFRYKWCSASDKEFNMEMFLNGKEIHEFKSKDKKQRQQMVEAVKEDVKSVICPQAKTNSDGWQFTDKVRVTFSDRDYQRLISVVVNKEECL